MGQAGQEGVRGAARLTLSYGLAEWTVGWSFRGGRIGATRTEFREERMHDKELSPSQRRAQALAEARRLARLHGLVFDELKHLEPKGPSQWERDRQVVLGKVQQLVDFWTILPHELGREVPRARKDASPVAPKYRHPVTGDTWSGRGPQPQWLKTALTTEGYRVRELRVGAPETDRR